MGGTPSGTLREGHEVEAFLAFPPGGSGTSVFGPKLPPLVKPGTKSLRAALEGAGLGGSSGGSSAPASPPRPSSGPTSTAWSGRPCPGDGLSGGRGPHPGRGEAGGRRTRRPAWSGCFRASPEGPKPLPLTSSAEAPPFQDGDLLLLPDGRRGYFGADRRVRRLLLEVDGVATGCPGLLRGPCGRVREMLEAELLSASSGRNPLGKASRKARSLGHRTGISPGWSFGAPWSARSSPPKGSGRLPRGGRPRWAPRPQDPALGEVPLRFPREVWSGSPSGPSSATWGAPS